jgi:hypothetical protein
VKLSTFVKSVIKNYGKQNLKSGDKLDGKIEWVKRV